MHGSGRVDVRHRYDLADFYVMDSALPGMHYRPSEMRRHSLLSGVKPVVRDTAPDSCQLKVSPEAAGLRG